MQACVDVHYDGEAARAALVLFVDWSAESPSDEIFLSTQVADSYQPGQFYRRELAPIIDVIGACSEPIDTLVIDGYCQLSPDGEPGLGAHVHEALGSIGAIVGVAKSSFVRATHAIEVLRGKSSRPLLVTALGIDPRVAAAQVERMHGEHRIPTLLKRVDRLARDGV